MANPFNRLCVGKTVVELDFPVVLRMKHLQKLVILLTFVTKFNFRAVIRAIMKISLIDLLHFRFCLVVCWKSSKEEEEVEEEEEEEEEGFECEVALTVTLSCAWFRNWKRNGRRRRGKRRRRRCANTRVSPSIRKSN